MKLKPTLGPVPKEVVALLSAAVFYAEEAGLTSSWVFSFSTLSRGGLVARIATPNKQYDVGTSAAEITKIQQWCVGYRGTKAALEKLGLTREQLLTCLGLLETKGGDKAVALAIVSSREISVQFLRKGQEAPNIADPKGTYTLSSRAFVCRDPNAEHWENEISW
jgi:hypothetical protein